MVPEGSLLIVGELNLSIAGLHEGSVNVLPLRPRGTFCSGVTLLQGKFSSRVSTLPLETKQLGRPLLTVCLFDTTRSAH